MNKRSTATHCPPSCSWLIEEGAIPGLQALLRATAYLPVFPRS